MNTNASPNHLQVTSIHGLSNPAGPWPSALQTGQTGEDRSGHGSPEKRAAGSTGLVALALARIGGVRDRQPLSSAEQCFICYSSKKKKKTHLLCLVRQIDRAAARGLEGRMGPVVGKDWGCKEGGEWTMGGKGILVRWRGGAIVFFCCGWRYVPLL